MVASRFPHHHPKTMRFLYLVLMAAIFTNCSRSPRISSSGSIPNTPSKPRVLLVAQDANAQLYIQAISRSLTSIGMEPFLDGTVLREVEGPGRFITTSDTAYQSRNRFPFTTSLYPTPQTDLTLLLTTRHVINSRYALTLNLVDSKDGRLWYSASMDTPDITNLAHVSTHLTKELRAVRTQAVERAIDIQ